MSDSTAFLGVDCGTGKVAVAVVDIAGVQLHAASRPHTADLSAPNGRHEQDAERIIGCAEALVREIPYDLRARIAGIGFTGQMHGVVLHDAFSKPLSPLVTWQDQRAAEEPTFLPSLGRPLSTGFGMATLAWWGRRGELPANARAATIHGLLAARWGTLDRAPIDPEPRLWLARVYMASAQYAEAVRVFEALNALVPDQPAVLLQYADALAMTHNGVLAGKATELIHRALVLEPENVTGLWLAGVAADAAGKAPEALAYLRRARQASATTELPTAELDALISEVETRSRLKIEAVSGRVTAKEVPVAAGIAVNVRVDQAMVADLPPDTVVFVLAKALNGPPMPLAVKRLSLRELPLTITLDDSLAMAPQFKLSTAEQVMVTARISRGGEPIAHAGDIEGTAGPLRVGIDTSVNITINAVIH